MNKIPRGVISHKLIDSFSFLLKSFFSTLNNVKKIKKFEVDFAKYNKAKHCVVFPFARTAIYFILKSQNYPPGTKILMPPITIKGIVDVVLDLKFVPVYVELDLESLSFDYDDLKSKISSETKVVIITPLFGLVPNYHKLLKLLKSQNIFIIEDFSQCLNGKYSNFRIGISGNVGVYSSSSIKTLDTLGGGLAITNNTKIYQYLLDSQRTLSKSNRLFLIQKAWINFLRNFLTNKYIFGITFHLLQVLRLFSPGATLKQTGNRNKKRLIKLPELWFCAFSSLQASIGIKYLNKVRINDKKRISNVKKIKSALKAEPFPVTTDKSYNVYWQFIVYVKDSIYAQQFFSAWGIDIATTSLELVSSLKQYPGKVYLPIATYIYKNAIFIPCFPDLTPSDLSRIKKSLTHFHDFRVNKN